MWDLLKKTDIEQAKQKLKLRRSDAIRRHAEESQNLDTDQAEVETLNHLIDIFAQKFSKSTISSHKPIPAPIPDLNIGAKISHEARHQSQRHKPQTVFATFMRAAARG
jgi:hypothetical protein